MAKKNISESNNSPSSSRERSDAKPQAQRQSAAIASPSRAQSGGDSAAAIDTAADMSHAASSDSGNPRYEEIAEAAYHRFLRRGGQDGGDVEDWVEAERELRSRRFR